MPSPIGHALGGIAVGALIARRGDWRLLAACALAGVLADLDFLLPIRHRGPSHGLGAAALALGVTLVILSVRSRKTGRWWVAAAVGLAYASHTLLDWLGADSSVPRGLMALWPVSSTYYISGLDVFNSVDRRYWMAGFWARNTIAVIREIAILGPLVLISVSATRRASSYRRRGAAPPRA